MRQVFENLWHLMADRVECRILGAYGEGMQELCEFGSVLSQTLLMLLCGKRGSKQKPSRSRNPSDRSPIVSATDRMICRQLRVKNWILRLRLIFLFFFFFFALVLFPSASSNTPDCLPFRSLLNLPTAAACCSLQSGL